jgi:anti-sigma regulatory factor (Ser/Thr protein kinase)
MESTGITPLMHTVTVSPTGPVSLEVTLPGTARSASTARHLAAAVLGDCPRADDLLLALAELASNAVMHSASGEGGAFTVRVRTAARWARIEVADDGPAILPPEPGNSYGLALADAATDHLGTFLVDGQRTAYAEVTWPGPGPRAATTTTDRPSALAIGPALWKDTP